MKLYTKQIHGGTQEVHKFDNGYGASIVRHAYSYGGDSGFYEIAMVKWYGSGEDDWDICYDFWPDVKGWTTYEDCYVLLAEIASIVAPKSMDTDIITEEGKSNDYTY